MQNLLTIAGRQFRSYFNGAIAYIIVCFILLVVGFYFWETFFLYRRATAREFFSLMSLLNYLALPALTMGLLAEEKRTGTIEILITMPVTETQVILGKFLGVLGLYAVVLLLNASPRTTEGQEGLFPPALSTKEWTAIIHRNPVARLCHVLLMATTTPKDDVDAWRVAARITHHDGGDL